ncbi:unnamed protein product, partial [Meganyctiphanes norvegica]
RFHMGWLQLKRWLSFLPAAFVVYILLHYLVYQPADLASRHNQPVLVSAPRSADGSQGSADGASKVSSRSLQSGPRVLPLVQHPSVPDGEGLGEPQTPQHTVAATGGGGTNDSGLLLVTSDSPPPPQEAAAASAAAVVSKEDINNTGTGGGVTPEGNGDPTSSALASRFDSSSAPGGLSPPGPSAGVEDDATGGLLLLGDHVGGLIGSYGIGDTGYVSSGSEGRSPEPDTASGSPADEISVSPSGVSASALSTSSLSASALSASREVPQVPSQPSIPVRLPPRFNNIPKVAPIPKILPKAPTLPAQPPPKQPQVSPYEQPMYPPHIYGDSQEYGFNDVGVDRDHFIVGYHDPVEVPYDPYSPHYNPSSVEGGVPPSLYAPRPEMRQYFIADDSYNEIVPRPGAAPHYEPPQQTQRESGSVDSSAGNSSSNKIVLLSEEPQSKSSTAQAQASSPAKPSVKGTSTSQTAKASAAASVPAAPSTAGKEPPSKPQAGMGVAAGLGDSNKSGSVAVVHSSGAAPQTVTKKTTVVKKSNVASSGGLAINALKGKTTVGQKYESGFSFPHEELCMNNGRDLKVLVLITTAPDHEKHRTAIRQTWGHWNLRKDVVMAFMVGRTSNANTQNLIDRENEQYSDIIQANFIDHYSNLTLKTVSMFEWVKTYCSESHFVLKTDDDMFINMPYLLSFIDSKKNDKKVMYGRLAKGWKPVRNRKSKYFIDTATYSKTKYPDFLTGPAYLFTSDIVDDIFTKALGTTFFVLEDVLLTGIVGESLRIKRVGDSRFRNEKIKLTDTCQLLKTISIHMVKYEEQFDIYKRTLDGKAKCKKNG